MTSMPPYAEAQFQAEEPVVVKRTSALAVTSLVLAIVACCPILGLVGPLLGLIALVLIVTNPALKGAVLAIAGIVIGLALQVAVFVGIGQLAKLVEQRPMEFIDAIEASDWDAARAASGGAAAAATDAEYAAFAAQFAATYGTVTNFTLLPPPPGTQPGPDGTFPWSYEIDTTAGGTAELEFEIVIVDEASGSFVWRPGSLVITNADGSTIVFPPVVETPNLPEAAGESIDGAIDEAGDAAGDAINEALGGSEGDGTP